MRGKFIGMWEDGISELIEIDGNVYVASGYDDEVGEYKNCWIFQGSIIPRKRFIIAVMFLIKSVHDGSGESEGFLSYEIIEK